MSPSRWSIPDPGDGPVGPFGQPGDCDQVETGLSPPGSVHQGTVVGDWVQRGTVD